MSLKISKALNYLLCIFLIIVPVIGNAAVSQSANLSLTAGASDESGAMAENWNVDDTITQSNEPPAQNKQANANPANTTAQPSNTPAEKSANLNPAGATTQATSDKNGITAENKLANSNSGNATAQTTSDKNAIIAENKLTNASTTAITTPEIKRYESRPINKKGTINYFDMSNDFTPESITKHSENNYIVADYRNLYMLSRITGYWLLKSIPIIDPQGLVSNKANEPFRPSVVSTYNPTGIHYNQEKKILYMANFNGHNILEAKVEGTPPVATITRNFVHPDLLNPENVYVDAKQNLMAVTDYDASNLLLFNLEGKLLWKKELKLPYGILIDGDFLYVTTLGDKPPIKKINMKGEIVTESEKNDITKFNLLTPIQITKIPRGEEQAKATDPYFAVIDADAGGVSFFNSELQFIEKYGVNGPLDTQFNRPYGLYVDTNRILVGDGAKHRIVIMDRDFNVTDIVGVNMPISVGVAPTYGEIDPYISNTLVPTFIEKMVKNSYSIPETINIVVGYQTLKLLKGKAIYTSALMPTETATYRSLKRPTSTPLGYIWVHEYPNPNGKGKIAIFGSPDTKTLLVFDESTSTYHRIVSNGNIQTWGSESSPYFNYLEGIATNEVNRFYKHLEECNNNPMAGFIVESFPPQTIANTPFQDAVAQLFFWKPSDQIVQAWKSGQNLQGYYADWIKQKQRIVLEDALLLSLMQQHPYAQVEKDFIVCAKQPPKIQS
jgi:hypothetical protein